MINNEEYKKDAIELYKCCDAIVDRIVNLRLNNKETVAEMAGTHSLMEKTIVDTMQFISCSLDYIKEINEKADNYKAIIEKLRKENIELKIKCSAAIEDIETLLHDDCMGVCDLCDINQRRISPCDCENAHWRGVQNEKH